MTILQDIKHLPSKHLGWIKYVEHPTNKNYECSFVNITDDEQNYIDNLMKNVDFPYLLDQPIAMTLLPDFIRNYINHTIDIKIPRYEFYDNENVYTHYLWGTDIYTDDSDIVAILYHCGILKSNDPLADLKSLNKTAKSIKESQDGQDGNKVENNWPIYPVQSDDSTQDISDTLIVRVRILPCLERYQGCYRHNYNSRNWCNINNVHDGVSISVESVRWNRKC